MSDEQPKMSDEQYASLLAEIKADPNTWTAVKEYASRRVVGLAREMKVLQDAQPKPEPPPGPPKTTKELAYENYLGQLHAAGAIPSSDPDEVARWEAHQRDEREIAKMSGGSK